MQGAFALLQREKARCNEAMIEKTVRMSLLFDFYGQLLTDRQREFFTLYYNDDLSLGEIAHDFGVSRQAVYDILRRSTQTLVELEEKLELLRRHEEQVQVINELDQEVRGIEEALHRLGVPEELIGRLERVRHTLRTLH